MSSAFDSSAGPHQRIHTESPRDRFTLQLFDRLWNRYRQRVAYVRMYEQMVRLHGGTFVNDHIAFRTLATQSPSTGIHSLSRIFEALGYQAAGAYQFSDKHLSAMHYQHPHPDFPKLFISELRSWELDPQARRMITTSLQRHRPQFADDALAELASLRSESDTERLLDQLVDWFTALPWQPPLRSDVEVLNKVSQYGAWVLVHGYNVNHFTSLINSHGVESLDTIESTIEALRQSGVPMKAEIEGEHGSKLRQTATEAAMTEVTVCDEGQLITIPWTYAYFELAQRDMVSDPATGKQMRFEGFLGPQATNLFEMTRVK